MLIVSFMLVIVAIVTSCYRMVIVVNCWLDFQLLIGWYGNYRFIDGDGCMLDGDSVWMMIVITGMFWWL